MQAITQNQAIVELSSGNIGVLPTDTLMGIVCAANNVAAVKRVYALKNRERKPGTIIAASTDQVVQLGIKKRYLKAVSMYWPNPISVVVPCADSSLTYLHQGKQTLAVRIPATPRVRSLLEATGPLLTTSANMPGNPPAETVEKAQKIFGSRVDFYVVEASDMLQQPSTVIHIVDDTVSVLRQGAVIINEQTGEITS